MLDKNEVIFRSQIENLVPNPIKELIFPSTAGFGSYKYLFCSDSVAHPAKANLHLLRYLIAHYTKEGDTVLDPMAGISSTIIIAGLMDRRGIAVELEERFCDWSRKNVTRLKALKSEAQLQIIQGDARKLSELLRQQADTILTSPPFAESVSVKGDPTRRAERMRKAGLDPRTIVGGQARCGQVDWRYGESKENIGNLPLGSIDAVITSPPYSNIAKSCEGGISPHMQGLISKLSGIPVKEFAHNVKRLKEAVAIAQSKIPFKYSDDNRNIGNLPHGEISVIITSPPYSESMSKRRKGYTRVPHLSATRHMGADSEDDNIGNLRHGSIDAIITSPPYADAKKQPGKIDFEHEVSSMETNTRADTKHRHSPGRIKAIKSMLSGYSKAKSNIGNLPFVDTVITSPPYEGSLEGTSRHTRGGIASRDPALAQTGTYATTLSEATKQGVPIGYSSNEANIGNLKSDEKEYKALVDSIITSPPYAHESTASKPTRLEKHGLFKMGHSKESPYTQKDYRGWDRHTGGNIGKKKLFVRVPCSQEEAQFHDIRKGRKGTIWEWTKEVEASAETIERIQKLKSEKKGKSETYLEAMLQVYCEMFQVLQPGGPAIIIVKPFIRNKKVVDLPYHTWLLLERAGFKLAEVLKVRLPQESFWRVLYHKKHPAVTTIAHEYVLVTKKGLDPRVYLSCPYGRRGRDA